MAGQSGIAEVWTNTEVELQKLPISIFNSTNQSFFQQFPSLKIILVTLVHNYPDEVVIATRTFPYIT